MPFLKPPVLAAAAATLALAGCATAPRPGPDATAPAVVVTPRHDPFEGANRGLFRLGDILDRGLVSPLLAGYRRIFPRPVRHAVHNVVTNLDEPVVFVNDLLQARPKTAARTAVRFFANSTVGVGGIFDAASTAGIAHHDNGFGSTLGRWGVGPGPYIYVPLLGPTTLRDVAGDGVDWVTDPFAWMSFRGSRRIGVTETAVSLLDEREQVEAQLRALRDSAVDPYASLRSAYLQSREAEVKGPDASMEALPELPEPQPDAAPEPPPSGAPQPEAAGGPRTP